MTYKAVLTQLYYLLIHADGDFNTHELASGKWLAKIEGIDADDFSMQLELLKSKEKSALLTDCIKSLKNLSRIQQIRIVAWLCVIANGDGFMDKAEWQMIYKIYHKELHLPLEEIFKVQKEINRLPRERSSIGGFINSIV
jgi:uncharacterized tellurite resistance protein B-like protein